MRNIIRWVWFPWLLTLYIILYLYSINLGDLREKDVIEVILVVLTIVTIVYIALYLFIRNAYKTGATTGILALIILTYGHFEDVAPVMVILGILLIYFVWRSNTFWKQFTPYANGIAAVLLLMVLWPIVNQSTNNATAQANPLERPLNTPKVNNSADHPDIYYIILDAYSRNDFLLENYGYDNSAFTDALEEYGFFIADESQSNYGVTLVSLPSSLNMRYITEEDRIAAHSRNIPDPVYLKSLIANNQVATELKQSGYTFVYMLSGYLSPSIIADTNVVFYPDGPEYFSGTEFSSSGSDGTWAYKQPFWPFFIKTTALRSMASRFETQADDLPYPIYSPEILLATFEELEKIPAMPEATFTLAHIIKPHGPIRFDREGNIIEEIDFGDDMELKAEYFFEELEYLNERVLGIVDHILEESTVPPIIIIQADHGSDLGNPWDPAWRWTHFDILNAFYLPGYDRDDFDAAIAPINSFRMIFNHYFDGNYEFLESRQYTIPRGWEYQDYFTHVPYLDDKRLNVDLGDNHFLVYNGTSENGSYEFQVYDVSDGGEKGDLLTVVTDEQIAPFLNTPPPEHTLVHQQGPVAFYALSTGEFQFNLGPDADGQTWAVVMDEFPARVVYGYKVGE